MELRSVAFLSPGRFHQKLLDQDPELFEGRHPFKGSGLAQTAQPVDESVIRLVLGNRGNCGYRRISRLALNCLHMPDPAPKDLGVGFLLQHTV